MLVKGRTDGQRLLSQRNPSPALAIAIRGHGRRLTAQPSERRDRRGELADDSKGAVDAERLLEGEAPKRLSRLDILVAGRVVADSCRSERTFDPSAALGSSRARDDANESADDREDEPRCSEEGESAEGVLGRP
jgi:hypothetical protein